jgi:8-oxo-dGTP diphosphatase
VTVRAYGPSASFCPRCAKPLPGAPPTACVGCGYQLFVNARPTVNLVVLDESRFLALKRAAEPRAGLWETPGGFCDGWEHPAEAAVREGREELGTDVALGEFIGMYVGSYDYQGETLPVLESFFLATVAGQIILDPAESSDMKWFELGKRPPLAFSTMDQAVRDVARTLGI